MGGVAKGGYKKGEAITIIKGKDEGRTGTITRWHAQRETQHGPEDGWYITLDGPLRVNDRVRMLRKSVHKECDDPEAKMLGFILKKEKRDGKMMYEVRYHAKQCSECNDTRKVKRAGGRSGTVNLRTCRACKYQLGSAGEKPKRIQCHVWLRANQILRSVCIVDKSYLPAKKHWDSSSSEEEPASGPPAAGSPRSIVSESVSNDSDYRSFLNENLDLELAPRQDAETGTAVISGGRLPDLPASGSKDPTLNMTQVNRQQSHHSRVAGVKFGNDPTNQNFPDIGRRLADREAPHGLFMFAPILMLLMLIYLILRKPAAKWNSTSYTSRDLSNTTEKSTAKDQ